MTDEQPVEKTPLEKSRDIVTQLKEMQHYAKTNIEKLTAFWLQLDDELGHKDVAKKLESVLSKQNAFHDELETAIADLEAACERAG